METKKHVLIRLIGLLTILLTAFSCSNKETAKVSVQINGLENNPAIIQEQRVNGIKILDTVFFNSKGKLKYTFEVKQPTFYNVIIPSGSDIFLLLYPDDNIKITGESDGRISNLHIQGSEESAKLSLLYDSLYKTRELLKGLRDDFNASTDESERNNIVKEYTKTEESYKRYSTQFVLDNLSSLTSIAALYQEVGPNEFVFGRRRDMQFFKLVSDTLTKYYPKHRHVLALNRNFSSMMENIQFQRIMSEVENIEETRLPELKLPDMNSNIKALTKLNSRYVFLNFYTHNDPSNSEIFKSLNSSFRKYAPKGFNIYNVYLGKSVNAWKKTVNFEEINSFVNVADTAFPYSQSRIAYNVQLVPSNYLIDLEEEKILVKDLNPADLNKVLAELIK